MNEKEILEFYRRVVFGKEYGKISKQLMVETPTKNLQDLADEIKKVCFLTAWNDMARHQKDINDKYKEIAKSTDISITLNKKGALSNRTKFIYEVYKKCKKYLDNSSHNSQNAINGLNNSVFNKHFEIGKIQKIVNMYYKYLSTFTLGTSASIIQLIFGTSTPNFDGCDCPIDNYILTAMVKDNILTKEEQKNITWSSMDSTTYIKLQQELKKYIKQHSNIYKIPLDYDFKNFG